LIILSTEVSETNCKLNYFDIWDLWAVFIDTKYFLFQLPLNWALWNKGNIKWYHTSQNMYHVLYYYIEDIEWVQFNTQFIERVE
jgi:uncharacterized protein (DUF302 family)